MQNKLIMTAALAGAATTKQNNPNTPYSPEEFAEESYRCYQEEVSIVHIHAKDPNTGLGTMDLQAIRDTIGAIQQRCPELIINISTGSVLDTPEVRLAPILDLKPEVASLNTNTMNFALANHKTGEVMAEYIFTNTFELVTDFAKKMKQNGVKPEFEVYDPGGLQNICLLRKQNGLFAEPMNIQFVYGVSGGMSFSPLLHLSLVEALPENGTFSVCGVGPNQQKAALQSAITGGHIRIGLEDNTRMPNGEMAKGSWEQATWARNIAIIAGRTIATPDEARTILGLKQ